MGLWQCYRQSRETEKYEETDTVLVVLDLLKIKMSHGLVKKISPFI